MAIEEVRVGFPAEDPHGRDVREEAARSLGIDGIQEVRASKVYRVEGISAEEADTLRERLFADPVVHESSVGEPLHQAADATFEVAYKPGVMNPERESIMKAANELGIRPDAVDSSVEYALIGSFKESDLALIQDRLLVNQTVQHVVDQSPETLQITGEVGPVETVPIRGASDEELMTLSEDKLFLNLEEMQVIRDHAEKIGRDLTDCELELIAGRWSEHCGHKTFKAKVFVEGPDGERFEKPPLFERISTTAEKYFGDSVVTAFEDNAGGFRFQDGLVVVDKVETHNSPSAIEPYGGAATGSGGVFRDILGTGQGAENILSTDMFCFAPPDLDPKELPPGTLYPDYLLRRTKDGVRDYGNRMGIPTGNGSYHFHPDFRAKPTVIVGAVGMIPEERAPMGHAAEGDLVVTVGGRTGRDGIHGATFSSGEMTERTSQVSGTAVQIGNAIEEKRMSDAILEARDRGLVRAITDCGAAGYSSAIGEMAEDTGVTVDLSTVPLKYEGLAPWEIWMSESQERMVLAIDPENIEEFQRICAKYNAEATVLGEFDGTHELTVTYGDQVVANLDYEFLKHGLPQREMEAKWEPAELADGEPTPPETPEGWRALANRVLGHWNVCSREPVVRQYDHTVQGRTVVPPYGGLKHDAPNDAIVLTPDRDSRKGLVHSHGMNPILNRIDPYHGAIWASVEGMANYVAVGGNPDDAYWVGNYIWPFPDKAEMGSLDRAVDGACAAMEGLERPIISGKDSLSSTYRNKQTGDVIKIPPVYCLSVSGTTPDVEKVVTADFKRPGSPLYLIGTPSRELGGSTYYDLHGLTGTEIPVIDLKQQQEVFRTVFSAIEKGEIRSCHDISEGGLLAAVAEMGFGGDLGVKLSVPKGHRTEEFLFHETAGCFVVELEDGWPAQELFQSVPHEFIGWTSEDPAVCVSAFGEEVFSAPLEELKESWKRPMREVL